MIWIDPAKAEAAGFSSLMLKAIAHARRFVEAGALNKRSYGPLAESAVMRTILTSSHSDQLST